jgi:hypothetical protein
MLNVPKGSWERRNVNGAPFSDPAGIEITAETRRSELGAPPEKVLATRRSAAIFCGLNLEQDFYGKNL